MKKVLMTVMLLVAISCLLSNKTSAQTGKVTMVFSIYVDNYDAWKTKFDGGAQFRADAGIKVISISRNIDDQNAITVIEEAASKESADEFLKKLKAIREKNGDKAMASVELFQPIE